MSTPKRIKTISEFYTFRGLGKPLHPLVAVVDYAEVKTAYDVTSWVLDFYSISVKRNSGAKIRYGQQSYDFDDGVMFFISPEQVFSVTTPVGTVPEHSGWMLLVHPDFLWGSPLANGIRNYDFFGYEVHEALFLSDKEEQVLADIVRNISQEIDANLDAFSQNIIVAHLTTLLRYAERFYERQFLTRRAGSHQTLEKLEQLLESHFAGDGKGLPTVQQLADALHMSPGYLSNLLRNLTGKSTQQHIHDKLIEKAKERLSTTSLSISEIAYALGFEHPQSFSKLFKSKADLSPLEFRQSFN